MSVYEIDSTFIVVKRPPRRRSPAMCSLLLSTARTGRLTQDHGRPDPAHQEPTWTKTSGEREAERLLPGEISQETITPPCDEVLSLGLRRSGERIRFTTAVPAG
jgi:hypothetical protein